MARLQDRIPREQFQGIFRPMVRTLGTKNVILRLNEGARTAIPRQTSLDQFMPKLELLCYEQKRPLVDEALEQLLEIYLDGKLGEKQEKFQELSDALNKTLEEDKVPEAPEKREATRKAILEIITLLKECELESGEIEAIFRVKAFPEVLKLFLELWQV
jgi:hypothetical protein